MCYNVLSVNTTPEDLRDTIDRYLGTPFAVRLPPETLDRLRAAAKKRDRSVAYLIREAVEDWLKRKERA